MTMRTKVKNKLKTWCKHCGEMLETKEDVQYHTKSEHLKRGMQCKECDKILRTNSGYKMHTKTHLKIFDNICSKCGKGYAVSQNLRKHEKVCRLMKPKCDVCDLLFRSNRTLTMHKRIVHKIDPYVCKICKKNYAEDVSFIRHFQRSHNTKRFCNTCEFNSIELITFVKHLKELQHQPTLAINR